MSHKLHNVQALRGVAVLLVVLYHLGAAETKLWPFAEFKCFSLFGFGFGGVDLFFVISGFIITWVNYDYLGDAGAIPRYLTRRLIRIYPLYLIVFAFIATTIYFELGIRGSVEYVPFVEHVKSLLLLPQHSGNAIVPDAWSLVFEVIFYAIFCVFMLTPPNRFVQLLAFWTALVVGLNLAIGATESALVNVLLSPLNLEFITGCLIGVVIQKRLWVSPKVIIAIGLFWFAVGVVANAKDFANFDLHWTRLIAFGLPSGLIVYACCVLEARDNNRLPTLFQKLGDASYSIYLTHLTLFSAVRRYSHGSEVVFGPEYGALTHFAWNMLMLLAVFGGGIAVYHLIEVPLLKVLRSLFVGRRKPLLFAESTTGSS